MPPSPLQFFGVHGSPYTRKMLALLRYRHIPYRYSHSSTGIPGLPAAKPALLPTFYLPDASGTLQPATDSTPLIRRFEADFAGRAAVPPAPALAFIDALLEDFADEWLTKAMFHYRWAYPADAQQAMRVLACWRAAPQDDAALAATAALVHDRQVPRLRYVGSNASTAAVIEAGYQRVLLALEDHFRHHPFLMGDRPGASDFGVFGQLTQLLQFDPTPTALASATAPRVMAWTGRMDDLSGLDVADTGWLDAGQLPASLRALLAEVGRLYAPLLLANAQALAAGQATLRTTIDGQPWAQQAFPYQGKCLAWLRRDHAALAPAARAQVDAALAGTGCEALFCAA